MAIKHIIRCDGPKCSNERPLESIQARHPGANPEYSRPESWPSLDGRDFCSYGCLANYAGDRAQNPEKYVPIYGEIATLVDRRPLVANYAP